MNFRASLLQTGAAVRVLPTTTPGPCGGVGRVIMERRWRHVPPIVDRDYAAGNVRYRAEYSVEDVCMSISGDNKVYHA